MNDYEAVIGIETHVQLRTKSKLFCGCSNDSREAAPNTNICPVCLGLPGTLPVLNEAAVGLGIRAGLALNGKIVSFTKFDRKNYFYPDLPKGYQITQFDQPIVGVGKVEAPLPDGSSVSVGITRAHMEEDAGKLVHPDGADFSLVDLNRAGTPLLEIVSEPDMRSAAEAKAYATELYNLMRYADVSDADLYYGNMRFDVNVSVRKKGATALGTRSETKNLNSFRNVERAVEYEISRQVKALEAGERIVQETRGWDDAKGQTFSQRSKEEAMEYRYFPEPDLPPLVINDDMIAAQRDKAGLSPADVREQLDAVGLGFKEREALVDHRLLAQRYFESVEKAGEEHAKALANIFISDVLAYMNANPKGDDESITATGLDAGNLAELAVMKAEGKLNSNGVSIIATELCQRVASPNVIANEKNLLQVSDTGAIEKLVDEVIAAHPGVIEDYKNGKMQALGFLVGQVMKASKGQANPPMVNELLKKKLN